ncbi:hypothetical protein H0H92_016129 [Tricholoma furcatifolium]|nr:hypothetical protein H0H92_016129 [Tricholoma furcatifolium]
MQNTSATQSNRNRGLRLLALDDGGIRGLSELIILEEIMKRIKQLENAESLPKPCDYFDIIGGVGTGGVIALMLGRLRMPIDKAIEKYVEFSKNVYSDRKFFGPNKFKATTFVAGMKDIMQAAGFSGEGDILMMEDDPICRCFVTALPSDHTISGARIFRSYEVKANQGYNCTVIDAARATTATPGLFKAVLIAAGSVGEKFIGVQLGFNPIKLVLDEAELAFGGFASVACLMPLDDWNSLGEIKTHSLAYLDKVKVNKDMDLLVSAMSHGPPITTIHALRGTVFLNDIQKEQINQFVQMPLPAVAPPSELFIERIDILSYLEAYFNKSTSELRLQRRFVLYGLGGAGKTQIMRKFCSEYADR